MSEVIIKKYDYSKNEYIELATTSTYLIARNITPKQLSEIIDDYLNVLGKENAGKEVGKFLRETHPTLQRLAVVFALGILQGLSEKKYTDARNETAILTAKKINQMIESGELPVGAFI